MNMIMLTTSLVTAACVISQGRPSEQAAVQGRQYSLASIAGEYYTGDGLGVNMLLKVDAKGRFSFRGYSDVGRDYRNEGTAEIVNGRLILHPVEPDRHESITGTAPPELIPVRWGKRLYLLSEREPLKFCNAVNLGAEPREYIHGLFYLRMEAPNALEAGVRHVKLEAEGRPEVAKEWEPFLIKKPLRGKVTAIRGDKRMEIDLGAGDSLRKGMDLWVHVEGGYGFVTVLAVEAKSCTAEIKWEVFDDIGRLKVGQSVYSKVPRELYDLQALLFSSFMDPKSEIPPVP